jgi:hypothetical protein
MAFQASAFQNNAFQMLAIPEEIDDVIHNFVLWLRNQFPAETIYANERQSIGGAVIPDRCALASEGSGTEIPLMKSGFQMVQIITRDIDSPKARKFAWDFFKYITSRWGQKLPAVTIDGTVYPEIQTGQISAVARPQSLGADEEGRHEFSTNYQIYWRRT